MTAPPGPENPAPKRKTDSSETGRAAERLAAAYLITHGFRIIECNWTCRRGEIDIIAEEDGVIVFVEVKSRGRTNHGRPGEAVTRSKQARIATAAALYASSRGLADRAMRFDILEVTESGGKPRFQHFPNAFIPAGRYQVL